MIDVSIVLNLHDEAIYLNRTLRSIEEAVAFAQRLGIRCELVAVLDRPDDATKSLIDSYDFTAFDSYRIVQSDNGSLGLSRNDGIAAAAGEYLWMQDGDDLVSYNTISQAYLLAKTDHKKIYLSKYLIGFGERNYFWEYFGSDVIECASLFSVHPFNSHIFAHKSVFQAIKFIATPLSKGIAYEDWHFNCNAVVAGYKFAVIPDTVFFYRQRRQSLLKASNDQLRLMPFSEFFDPVTYIKTCNSARMSSGQTQYKRPDWREISEAALSSLVIAEFVHAANKYDPAVNFENFRHGAMWCNIPADFEAGHLYYQVCKLIGAARFTDVFLIPFMAAGGAEKYLLQVAHGLLELNPDRRMLFISGQRTSRHEWIEKLPPRSEFIDLAALSASTTTGGEPDLIALRLIQAVAPQAQIHIKCSPFANEFVKKYHSHLSEAEFNYYYFCDNVTVHHGLHFVEGYNFEFISTMAKSLRRVISDHSGNLEKLHELLNVQKNRLFTLKAIEEIHSGYPREEEQLQFRLLWASRLDRQKRPQLLIRIAESLSRNLPKVTIDVYGRAVLDQFDVADFDRTMNIKFKGPFSDFGSLDHANYDAVLYTAMFDGLPNILLEAMARGMIVIAPNVGGIGELVSAETGFIVENVANEEILVQSYVEAIRSLYDESTDRKSLRLNAMRDIKEKHSKDAYLAKLAQVFGFADPTDIPSPTTSQKQASFDKV